MSTFVVTVIVDGVVGGTFIVVAPREGLARTRAASMFFAAVESGDAVAAVSEFPSLSYVVEVL